MRSSLGCAGGLPRVAAARTEVAPASRAIAVLARSSGHPLRGIARGPRVTGDTLQSDTSQSVPRRSTLQCNETAPGCGFSERDASAEGKACREARYAVDGLRLVDAVGLPQ